MEKLKTYVLMVSREFPKTHPRAGEQTHFRQKILLAIGCPDCDEKQDLTGKNISSCNSCARHAMFRLKLHTIRGNYKLWEKRIKAVKEGRAVLSIRYWTGSPYNYQRDGSKQVEFAQLDKNSGIGIQPLIRGTLFDYAADCGGYRMELETKELAEHDGLSVEDFEAWFKNADLSEPLPIIHFTSFRY